MWNLMTITIVTVPFCSILRDTDLHPNGYCNLSDFSLSIDKAILMLLSINFPTNFSTFLPRRFNKIYGIILGIMLSISNAALVFIHIHWLAKAPKELFLEIPVNNNSFVNSICEFISFLFIYINMLPYFIISQKMLSIHYS